MRRRSLLSGIVGATALSWTGAAQPAPTEAAGRFLVKLITDLDTRKTKTGMKVSAFVISPERFLAGLFEGSVDRVSATELRFTFETLTYQKTTLRVRTTIIDFVNSKGHKLVDEQERPLQMLEGVVTSKNAGFTIDEGAEISIQVTPAK
jgi:hypothetical protein